MIASIGSDSLFAQYPDDEVRAAAAAHRAEDVVVAGTVVDAPVFFYGRHTRAWHETFSIVTEHGMRIEVIDNVDLAPRVPVAAGDVVAIAGQFVPTRHGAIIHDTHHCPGPGWHRGGWVQWHGRRFESCAVEATPSGLALPLLARSQDSTTRES
jgi:Protein of unknown function (DUF3465)